MRVVILRLTALLFFSLSLNTQAAELTYEDHEMWDQIPTQDIELSNDESYTMRVLPTGNPTYQNRLYLWIGQAYDPNDGDAILLDTLKSTGNIWFLDTPDALFTERDRTKMRNMDGEFLPALLDKATQSYQDIVIVTSDVGAVPVLRGTRLWQTQKHSAAKRNQIKSVVLLFPSLYVNTPAAGYTRELFPIAKETALPIAVIQPEMGAQANFIQETISALRQGGSLVQKIELSNSIDDNYRYENIRPMAIKTGKAVSQAANLQLAIVEKLHYQVPSLQPSDSLQNPPESLMVRGMKRIDPPIPMQNIILTDMNGHRVNLMEEYKGKSVLVNFWATWCPHCVEEIPSMNHAIQLIGSDDFDIVSISYRDTQEILDDFVKEVAVDFPILMDTDGSVSAQWKVFAFPSSFLVDRNGLIRYSINAGSIWDNEEMLHYLRETLEQPIEPVQLSQK